MKKLLLALLFLPTLLFAEEYNWRVFACDVRIPPAYIEQHADEEYQLRFNLWIDVDKSAGHIGDFAHVNNHRIKTGNVHIYDLMIFISDDINYDPKIISSYYYLKIDRTRIDGNTEYEFHKYDRVKNEFKKGILYRGTCNPDHKWTTKF